MLAVHRPRDIALVLDYSNSMRYGTMFNWASVIPTTASDYDQGGGMLSPDPLWPQFGHYSRYLGYDSASVPTSANQRASSPGTRPNPFYMTNTFPHPQSKETLAPHNYTVRTGGGDAAVHDFYTDPSNAATPKTVASPVKPNALVKAFHMWNPAGFDPSFDGTPTAYSASGTRRPRSAGTTRPPPPSRPRPATSSRTTPAG